MAWSNLILIQADESLSISIEREKLSDWALLRSGVCTARWQLAEVDSTRSLSMCCTYLQAASLTLHEGAWNLAQKKAEVRKLRMSATCLDGQRDRVEGQHSPGALARYHVLDALRAVGGHEYAQLRRCQVLPRRGGEG